MMDRVMKGFVCLASVAVHVSLLVTVLERR